MSLMSDLDRLADRMNLRKRFPDYFNVWVFRSGILLMVLFFVVVAWQQGFKVSPSIYLECPKDAFQGRCANPYFGFDCYRFVPKGSEDLCGKEFFFAGESYGVKPSWLNENFVVIGLLVVVLCFGVNHLLYRWRSGKWSF